MRALIIILAVAVAILGFALLLLVYFSKALLETISKLLLRQQQNPTAL